MQLKEKLAVLADAAKYDASCASSGANKRNSSNGSGIGSTEGMGICHSYAPDGRCISLLKLLLTNYCIYDCLYCVNRASSNVQRARFTVEEVVQLTLDFYRRNTIEGLFLSSGIIRNPDYTMEQVIEVARRLREDHDFRGYIHLKTIPDASADLLQRAGRYADRLSINVELPTVESLASLAPEKSADGIRRSMARTRILIQDAKEMRRPRAAFSGGGGADTMPADAAGVASAAVSSLSTTAPGVAGTGASAEPSTSGNAVASGSAVAESPAIACDTVARAARSNLVVPSTSIALPAAARKPTAIRRPPPRFALTGQSTQMIVGADKTDDRTILALSGNMYASYGLRRVYYSAFSPIPDASRSLPPVAPPLVREHRLYQADWLVRFYGFACDEVVGGESGMLDLDIDPKLSWALAHREQFPVDLNRAPRELMLRVPGLGVKAVDRLIGSRRARQVRTDDLARLRVSAAKVLPFVVMADHTPGRDADSATLGARLRPQPKQASLFDA